MTHKPIGADDGTGELPAVVETRIHGWIDPVQADADAAQATADQAIIDAANAQSTADGAVTDAATAQAAADAAQTTADTAFTDAAAAQATADAAIPATEKGANNGVATLDGGGKVPTSQLPLNVVQFLGAWDAATNTPTLADGSGDPGDTYIVSVAGTQNLGSGSITFGVGDWVIYNGTVWQKVDNTDAVVSVNGQTGIVTLDAADIPFTPVGIIDSTDVQTGLGELSDSLVERSFNVKDYGAQGNGSTDDTTAIADAISDAVAVGGGVVFFPPGVYITETITLVSFVTLKGAGPRATVIKLKNGTNADLITSDGFATYTGGATNAGSPWKFGLEDLLLDGNGDNQTGTSWTFRVYGSSYRINNVEIFYGLTGNVYSEFDNAGGIPDAAFFESSYFECFWSRFKIGYPTANDAVNLDWYGPSDSVFDQGFVIANRFAGPSGVTGQIGIRTTGAGAGAERFVGVHVYGFHEFGWVAEHSMWATACYTEGAYDTNLMLHSDNVVWHGTILLTNGHNPNEIGVQVGDTGFTNVKRADLNICFTGGLVAGSVPVNIVSSGGQNRIRGVMTLNGATAAWTGGPNVTDNIALLVTDGTVDDSKERIGHPVRILGTSNDALEVASSGSVSVLNVNTSSKAVDLSNGTLLRGYSGNFTGNTYTLDGATGAIRPGTTAGPGSSIYSGSAAPTLSGTAGDLYIRTGTPATSGQRVYMCTGTTNWVEITAGSQPLDATLTALSGLATGADQLPYSTGTDTFSQTTLTSFMRTVLDDTDAATARSTLGAFASSGGNIDGDTTVIATSGSRQLAIRTVANQTATLAYLTAGTGRWLLRKSSDTESGSNTGADFEIVSRTDAGAALATPFRIIRSTGQVLANVYPMKIYPAATGSRPSASTAGVGSMMFDTTLGKPIWSNGTNWVDATGTTV